MSKAKVYIEGEICSYGYYSSISGIREMLEYQGRFDEIEVVINSYGGDIAEGFGIYDLLQSYNVPITTIVIGQCCSAATIIFLAGSIRIVYENVLAFMVHKARGGPAAPATADELHIIADYIASYDERMKEIYMKKTGSSSETVDEWMSKDTYMSADEALKNGFATVIQKPVEARAKSFNRFENVQPVVYASRALSDAPAVSTESDSQNQSVLMSYIKDKAQRALAGILALASGKPIIAKAVSLKDGSSLEIDYAGESFDNGDPVKKDGNPAPDGTYILPDDTELIVKDGKISDIKKEESDEVEANADETEVTAEGETTVTASGETTTTETGQQTESPADELTRLRSENEQLKTQNTNLTTANANLNTRVTAIENKVKGLGLKTSQDILIPTNTQVQKKSVTAKATTDDEDTERAAMLAEQKAKWQKTSAE